MKIRHMLGSLFDRADPFLDATASGTGLAILLQMLRSRKSGMVGATQAGVPQAPKGQTANAFGLGKADEARLVHATFGGGLDKDELAYLEELFKALEPHQQKALRISITALEGGQTPKKDGASSSDVLTLKGLAQSARDVGIDKTKALLLAQGVIALTTPTQDAQKAVCNFVGLPPGRYTLEELGNALARRIPPSVIAPPQTESVGWLGYMLGKLSGTKHIKR